MLPNLISRLSAGVSPASLHSIEFSPLLAEMAKVETAEVFSRMKTAPGGLSKAEAAKRLEETGPNVVVSEKHRGWPWRLLTAARNPLVILLMVLAGISFATGDARAGTVMALMVILGVTLRFVQELRADAAAAKLKEMITVTTAVMRGGTVEEVPLKELVPGDIVTLSAGDMIPADVRVIAVKDLFVTQSALTGESLPVEKFEIRETRADLPPLEFSNLCFLGTSVESGAATVIVLATGARTYFGSMADSIVGDPVETSFDKGLKDFTWLMIRFMAVMVPLVFLINGFTKHNWHEAFFFSIAVAVGLTPEMLPMIVSVCLSKGALAMSRKKVIVKQLNAIQNFGAMDVLCTDKTGTLTMDQVILQRHCDVMKKENESVFFDAFLIAHFQTGLKSVLDRAVLNHQDARQERLEGYRKVDEIPFDFVRRMMSVVVEKPDKDHQLLTKGAPEAIFPRCTFYELDGEVFPLEAERAADLTLHYQELSADGFRVLAVAHKHFGEHPHITKDDECDLILKGYIAFLDPPKDSAAKAIKALQAHGVTIKVLTGDNDLVTRKVCCEVGLNADNILVGSTVEAMSEAELAEAVQSAHIFARLSPAHKQRIIRALQQKGHVVGFMGDGINDSPALHVADVGISVDSAVDIAKAAAAVILLEKDLMVLDDGVIEGRKVFVNILKYVRMGASSNFGNMFSVLGASAFLPFVPMAPIQILTNNLLYDFSQVPIPTDTVGPEQTAKPRPWQIGDIRKFVLFIGPISSIFDYTTFFVMLYLFGCWDPARASLFQTGWFVESLITQTLIIHVIRTNKLPFIHGRASWQVTMTTILVMAIAMWLPFSPVSAALGFTPLPALYWPILLVTVLCYVVLTQVVKMWLLRKALI
ncbi:MAG: mgtA 1 [Chthoniobacteraceae bacterium]|nr:mgtA 1 [Chthoniobacteraceae bacterium]